MRLDLQTASPSRDWTTRQLRAFIRDATKDLNKEFYEIQVAGIDLEKDSPLLAGQRDRLIELGTGREFRGGIGLGLTYKTKAELVMQARALRETYNILESPAKAEMEEAEEAKNYKSFTKNRPGSDISFSEYKEMTETMGALGHHVISEFFNSEDFVEMYMDAKEDKKTDKDIAEAVIEAQRQIRNSTDESFTPEKAIDLVRDILDGKV